MFKTSSLVAAGLAALHLANAQIAIPAVTGGSNNGGNGDCGGCYVGADVAAIAFGSEVATATATNQIIVMPGMNSSFTTTSLVFDQGKFTFAPVTGVVGHASAPAKATPLNVDTSTFVVSGVTLTSPTAYNVFTAYSVTSYEATNGGCRIVAGSARLLSSAFSVQVPQGVDYAQFVNEAERSFVSFLGLPTCSGGGENLTPTAIIPQTVVTTSQTTTARATLTPQPAFTGGSRSSTAGPTGPTSVYKTSIAGVRPNGTSTAYLPNGTGTIFVPGPSEGPISIAGAGRTSQAGSFLAGAAALLMGLVA